MQNNRKNTFVYGILLSIPAWLVSSIVISLITLLPEPSSSLGMKLGLLAVGTIFFSILILFLWIPFALLAGFIAKRKGRRLAGWFVGIVFVAMLLLGGRYVNTLSDLLA